MGQQRPGPGTGTRPRGRGPRLDMLLGIVGFFTAMALIQTVYFEVTGKPAAGSALLLLVLAVLFWLILRARRRLDD